VRFSRQEARPFGESESTDYLPTCCLKPFPLPPVSPHGHQPLTTTTIPSLSPSLRSHYLPLWSETFPLPIVSQYYYSILACTSTHTHTYTCTLLPTRVTTNITTRKRSERILLYAGEADFFIFRLTAPRQALIQGAAYNPRINFFFKSSSPLQCTNTGNSVVRIELFDTCVDFYNIFGLTTEYTATTDKPTLQWSHNIRCRLTSGPTL
jgi:hypothetical protein